MKKSPANKKNKGSKTYVVSGSRSSKEGSTTKVYRKDGSLKSERNVKDAGTKKETRYSASPRTLTRSKKQVDVKDPATRSYTKYKKDGTVKKSITKKDATNKRGTGVDVKVSRKINRKTTRDKRGAKNMTFKQDQRKDVDVKRSPAKKPLVGGQKKLPKELQQAILKSPGKMLTKSAIKMMDKSPAKKMLINPVEDERRKEKIKVGKRKNKKVVKESYSSPYGGDVKKKTKEVLDKKTGQSKTTKIVKRKGGFSGPKTKTVSKSISSPINMKTPMKKSKQKVEQDYARNAIADYKSGKTKEAKYEKKKALELAAGESPAKMKKKTTKSAAYVGDKSYGKKVTTRGNKVKTKEVYSEPGYSEIKKSKAKKDKVGYVSTKNSKKVIQRERPGKKAAKKMVRKGAMTDFESSMGSAIMMKKNPMMMKTNQSGGGYAAKNPAAPARQLKKLGSILSKHMKSN